MAFAKAECERLGWPWVTPIFVSGGLIEPLHQLRGIRLQVSPLVLVPEARRRDLRARRDRPKLRHLLGGDRPIERDELATLVFAHRWTPEVGSNYSLRTRSPARHHQRVMGSRFW